jgi:hypothetical protein
MLTKQNRVLKALALFVILFLSVAACNKETGEDTSLASYHIFESEKLVLPETIAVPVNPPSGNTRLATYFAEGVQKYKAQRVPGSDPVVYQWILTGPRANLYDVSNRKIGTHTAGPTWQLSANDSIYAQQFVPARAVPSADPLSVDWLQLMPKTGTQPTGVFANTTYIQRIATRGGKAPSAPPVSANDTVDVKYTAIYRFTRKN